MILKLIVFVITVVWIVLGYSDGELTKGRSIAFRIPAINLGIPT